MHFRTPSVRALLCATVVRGPLAILALVSAVAGCAGIPSNGYHSWSDAGGNRFDGLWREREPQSGTFTYINGDVYTGELSGWAMESGKGTMAYKNGCRYEGDWRDGRRHGTGVYSCPTGYTESGNYENGTLNGLAKISYAGGTIYEGQVKEGKKEDPQGTWRWPGGDEFKGGILIDRRNGAGLYTRASDGVQSLQFYRNEQLLVSIPILADGAEIACEAVPRGWRLASGACTSGRLDGVVELVSDDGWRRFKATYAGGAPQGRAVQDWIFNRENGAWQIVGTARGPDNFTSGNLIQSGYLQGSTDTYDAKVHAWRHIYAGTFKGAYPTTGRCVYVEEWEPCEYRGTERVDAVHLERMAEAERERIAYKRQEQEYAAAVRREEEERRAERAAEKREREDADREALQGYLNGLAKQTEQLESQRLANNARTAQLIADAQAAKLDSSAPRSTRRNRSDATEASQERRRSNDVPSATPDDEPLLTADNKPRKAKSAAAEVTKVADANPYEKYPAYDAPWGNPVAPWGGAASGLGSTRAEACSAAREKGLPEYIQRVESRGTRRVTQSSDCVCRNYAYGFGWIENVTCQIYVQIEVVKKGEGGTVDR